MLYTWITLIETHLIFSGIPFESIEWCFTVKNIQKKHCKFLNKINPFFQIKFQSLLNLFLKTRIHFFAITWKKKTQKKNKRRKKLSLKFLRHAKLAFYEKCWKQKLPTLRLPQQIKFILYWIMDNEWKNSMLNNLWTMIFIKWNVISFET